MKRLHEVMSTGIVKISPSESAESAWKLMQREHINHLVVMDDNDIIGILSSHALGGPNGEWVRNNRYVSDLMTPKPITADPATTVRDAIKKLQGYEIDCVLVMDNDKLVGIVTLTDMLELISKGLYRSSLKFD